MYSLGIVGDAFLGIVLTLDTWVYSLISSSYKIFMALASARLLSSDAYTEIANKVYIIVGVGMLFVLAYAILKAIIDPDQLSKGDMAGGKILKSVGIAVVGLIVTPLLFTAAYTVQNKVLEESILSKLFFRTSDSIVDVEGVGSVNYDEMITSTGGAVTATSVWQAFFYPADGVDPNEIKADPDIVRQTANLAAAGCAASIATGIITGIAGFFTGGVAWVITGAAVLSCAGAVIQDGNADRVEQAVGENGEFTLTEAYALVSSGESFAIFQAFLEPISDGDIKYTWLISTVFGAFVAYAFVTYAIDMGTRAAKLAYYQIIAPIPLILQILPKSGDKLSKYVKEVGKTFLDVLVRISIVYIIVYIICHLNELFSTVGALWSNNELSGIETLIAKALLIVGLVLFAKQAPKMIGDTFGLNTGGALDGLNLMKKLREGEVFTAGHVVGGTAVSAVKNFRQDMRRTKNDPNFKDKGLKRFGHAAFSGIAGGGSAAARSISERVKGGKDGAVKNFKDVGKHIESTSEKVTDAKNKRERFYKEYGTDENGEKRGSVETFVYGHAKQIRDKVDKFTRASIDTSYEDQAISMYGKIADQRDTYRSKTGKQETARFAQSVVDSIKKEGPPSEYHEKAYQAALQAVTNSVKREDYASDADYEAAVIRATRSINKEDYKNHNYLKELSEYQARTNAGNKFQESMQDVSIIELLYDPKQQAEMQQQMIDRISDIRLHSNDVLVDKNGKEVHDANGAVYTVGRYYEEVGKVDLSTGKIDFDALANANDNSSIKIEYTDSNGRVQSKNISVNVIRDPNSGKYIKTEYLDENNNPISKEDLAGIATKENVLNVSTESALNGLFDKFKDAKTGSQKLPQYISDKLDQRSDKK